MHFMTKLAIAGWLFATLLSAPASASVVDIDLSAADGTKLKATYASPDGPGAGQSPGMLLIHQCNMDRHIRVLLPEYTMVRSMAYRCLIKMLTSSRHLLPGSSTSC